MSFEDAVSQWLTPSQSQTLQSLSWAAPQSVQNGYDYGRLPGETPQLPTALVFAPNTDPYAQAGLTGFQGAADPAHRSYEAGEDLGLLYALDPDGGESLRNHYRFEIVAWRSDAGRVLDLGDCPVTINKNRWLAVSRNLPDLPAAFEDRVLRIKVTDTLVANAATEFDLKLKFEAGAVRVIAQGSAVITDAPRVAKQALDFAHVAYARPGDLAAVGNLLASQMPVFYASNYANNQGSFTNGPAGSNFDPWGTAQFAAG